MENETERKAVKEKLENAIRRLKLCESKLASSPALAERVIHLNEYVMFLIPNRSDWFP
jgi:hypothetical protein